eukprot:TRINITY_DN3410_c0_g1_i1.p1 TRINITY_DN3410_c0_g1~~TRINITY_DN3410_c0_g1_i1.p1  ORF type:complete len:1099 (-),score=310.42 TRINITY_DN3410_c0_g1_i1:121-3417(-)
MQKDNDSTGTDDNTSIGTNQPKRGPAPVQVRTEWRFKSSGDVEKPFDNKTSKLIENAYQSKKRVMDIVHGSFTGGYKIDFTKMTMTSNSTGAVSRITRNGDSVSIVTPNDDVNDFVHIGGKDSSHNSLSLVDQGGKESINSDNSSSSRTKNRRAAADTKQENAHNFKRLYDSDSDSDFQEAEVNSSEDSDDYFRSKRESKANKEKRARFKINGDKGVYILDPILSKKASSEDRLILVPKIAFLPIPPEPVTPSDEGGTDSQDLSHILSATPEENIEKILQINKKKKKNYSLNYLKRMILCEKHWGEWLKQGNPVSFIFSNSQNDKKKSTLRIGCLNRRNYYFKIDNQLQIPRNQLFEFTIPTSNVITTYAVNTTTATSNHIDLLMGFYSGDILVHEPFQKKLQKQFNRDGLQSSGSIGIVKWIPERESQFLVTFSNSGKIFFYDYTRPDEENILPSTQPKPSKAKSLIMNLTSSSSSSSSPSSSSQQPASTNDNNNFVCYLNTNTQSNPIKVWNVCSSAIKDMEFSPNGKYLAIVCSDGYLRVMDWVNELLLVKVKSYYGGLICVTWSPDNRFIATGGEDDLVSLWEWREDSSSSTTASNDRDTSTLPAVICVCVARGEGHKGWVSSIAFDSFQSTRKTYRFGSVGEDGKLCMWEYSDEDKKKNVRKGENNRRRNSLWGSNQQQDRRRSVHDGDGEIEIEKDKIILTVSKTIIYTSSTTSQQPTSPSSKKDANSKNPLHPNDVSQMKLFYLPSQLRDQVNMITPICETQLHSEPCSNIQFLPNGDVVTAGWNGIVNYWIHRIPTEADELHDIFPPSEEDKNESDILTESTMPDQSLMTSSLYLSQINSTDTSDTITFDFNKPREPIGTDASGDGDNNTQTPKKDTENDKNSSGDVEQAQEPTTKSDVDNNNNQTDMDTDKSNNEQPQSPTVESINNSNIGQDIKNNEQQLPEQQQTTHTCAEIDHIVKTASDTDKVYNNRDVDDDDAQKQPIESHQIDTIQDSNSEQQQQQEQQSTDTDTVQTNQNESIVEKLQTTTTCDAENTNQSSHTIIESGTEITNQTTSHTLNSEKDDDKNEHNSTQVESAPSSESTTGIESN